MRFSRIKTLCVCLIVGMMSAVFAQTSVMIPFGETLTGTVSPENLAPSFFFTAEQDQIFTVDLKADDPSFTPLLLLVDAQNQILQTVGGVPNMTSLQLTFTIPQTGQFYFQVQGFNGSTGNFTIILYEGDLPLIPTETPTSLPTATPQATSTPMAETGSLETLFIGSVISPQVDEVNTLIEYALILEADAHLVVTFAEANAPAVAVFAGEDEPFVTLAPPLKTAVLELSAGEYQVEVRHRTATGTQTAWIEISAIVDQPIISPTATSISPTEFPTAIPVTPTPTQITDVDLQIVWGDSTLSVINVSGQTLNLGELSLLGANRRVDSSFWANSTNIQALPDRACVLLRPLAYPDMPALPIGCTDLAAWWSADIVHVWAGEQFTVQSGVDTIATCIVSELQCLVDIPNA